MRNAQRAGFTLIELMVAMALTLFLMVILTQAFVTSLETFSGMKGIGDMQVNLRTAANILRNDLSQNHLDGDRRLSDVNAAGASPLVKFPNQSGFFAILQETQVGSATYVNEGSDTSGPSYRAVDHVLYMTVRRRGNRPENFFSTVLQDTSVSTATLSPALTAFFGQQTAYNMLPAPGAGPDLPNSTLTLAYPPPPGQPQNQAFYSSQWAEVAYFLVRTGSTEEPNNPASAIGTPTYGLYRAQFVMVPNGANVNALNLALASQQTFAGMSTTAGATLLFNSPDDAAVGKRVIPNLTPTALATLLASDARFQVSDAQGAVLQYATNLVLPNVLSFQVQVMPNGAPGFQDIPTFTGAPGATYGVFDTAKFNAAGYPTFALKGIQITLRVFDNASRQARQITIVQDL